MLAVLLASPLLAQSSVETAPSNTEALAIYEINRARANPQAYDTANSLGGILTGVAPANPLALNERLITSSRFHSTEMATNGYFAHTSAITGNQPNLMVRNAGYPLISSFPSAANNLESLACQFTSSSSGISYSAPNAILALIVDSGVSPPGHRYHLLATGPSASFYAQFREIGTGYAEGFRPESPFSAGTPPDGSGAYWAIHTGVRDTAVYFICGVVYNDANTNGRYDLGEGLNGVTVSANGGGSVIVNALTNSAGMYWLNLNPATWTLTCSGGTFGGPTYAQVTLTTNNIAVDFRAGNSTVDVNFGAWGALTGSGTQNGSTNPGVGSGGTSGSGSGGGGTPGPGPSTGGSSDTGGGGCTTDEHTVWFAALLAMLACALWSATRFRRWAF
jgi:uncharacterized protein YkwD